jgi:hypothetical protein
MEKTPSLIGLSALLKAGIELLGEFSCNQETGKQLKLRLALVVWTFGDPNWGLIRFTETTSTSFPSHEVLSLN